MCPGPAIARRDLGDAADDAMRADDPGELRLGVEPIQQRNGHTVRAERGADAAGHVGE